jgi:hypothetical protein
VQALLGPILGAVIDAQDFDDLGFDPVHDDEGADTSSRVPVIRLILGGGWIIPPYPAGDALEI